MSTLVSTLITIHIRAINKIKCCSLSRFNPTQRALFLSACSSTLITL
jgi:hypothetical protein